MAVPKPYDQAALQQKRQQFIQGQKDTIDRSFRGAQQEQEDAINRRMTSLGQANSGAAMNLQMKGRDQLIGQKSQALQDVAGQEMQLDMADRDLALKKDFFDTEQRNKISELDLAERQFQMDKDTTEFNKRMAELSMNQSDPGLFGDLSLKGIGKKGIGAAVGSAVMGPVGAIAGITKGGGK